MKTETEKELRELDCWIAEHISKCALVRQVSPRRFEVRYKLDEFPVGVGCGGFGSVEDGWDYLWHQIPHPTTNPANAMTVLERCGQKEIRGTSFVCIAFSDGNNSTLSKNGHWNVGRLDRDGKWVSGEIANALTLPIAICKFAKALYSK